MFIKIDYNFWTRNPIRIIEGSDNRGSDNRGSDNQGSTVHVKRWFPAWQAMQILLALSFSHLNWSWEVYWMCGSPNTKIQEVLGNVNSF